MAETRSVSIDDLQNLDEDEVRNSGYWDQDVLEVSNDNYLPNCTAFCAGAWMWCVQTYKHYLDIKTASKWYSYQHETYGYEQGSTPDYAAIACFSGGSSGWGHVAFVSDFEEDENGYYKVTLKESLYDSTYFRTITCYLCQDKPIKYTKNGNDGNLTLQGYLYHPNYEYTTTDESGEEIVVRHTKGRTYWLKKEKKTIDNLTADTAKTDEHWGSNFVNGGYSKSLTNPCAFALGAWSWCYGAVAEDQTFEKFKKRGYLGYPDDPRFLYSEYTFDESSTISLGALVCLDKTDDYSGEDNTQAGRVGMVTKYDSDTGEIIISFFDYNKNTGRVEVNNVGFDSPPNTGTVWALAGGGYCPGYMTHPYFEKYYWEEQHS